MEISVLSVSEVDKGVLGEIQSQLFDAFPGTICRVSEHPLPLSRKAYSSPRRQYVSSIVLRDIIEYAGKRSDIAGKSFKVLGVTEADLYAPGMNFVFGEAECPGKAAIISVHRLRPEFYGEAPDEKLFHERAVKEAVHEIGHTLGLRHCRHPSCVMLFSLHIGMTDQKQSRFCEECRLKVERSLGRF